MAVHTIGFSKKKTAHINADMVISQLGRKTASVFVQLIDFYLRCINEKPLIDITEDDFSRIAAKLLNIKEPVLVSPINNMYPYMQQLPFMQAPEYKNTPVQKTKDMNEHSLNNTSDILDKETENYINEKHTDKIDNLDDNSSSLMSDLKSFGIDF